MPADQDRTEGQSPRPQNRSGYVAGAERRRSVFSNSSMSEHHPVDEDTERRDSLLTHECGIALVRLLKPLSYYQEKYGNPLWGFTQLFLLMEKQHNRGQDGAGVACVKLDMPPGEPYMFRERNTEPNPLDKVLG